MIVTDLELSKSCDYHNNYQLIIITKLQYYHKIAAYHYHTTATVTFDYNNLVTYS